MCRHSNAAARNMRSSEVEREGPDLRVTGLPPPPIHSTSYRAVERSSRHLLCTSYVMRGTHGRPAPVTVPSIVVIVYFFTQSSVLPPCFAPIPGFVETVNR